MSKFLNVLPLDFYDHLTSNPEMYKSVVLDEMHNNTEATALSSDEIDYIAIVLSGYGITTPTAEVDKNSHNTIKKVQFTDGVPRFACNIRFINNSLYGSDKSLPTDVIPSPFDPNISETEKARRITMHPVAYTLYPTFEQNPLFFGTTVSVIKQGETYFIDKNITSPFTPSGGGVGTGAMDAFNPPQTPPPGEHPYRDMIIQGSKFPYAPVNGNKTVKGNVHIRTKLIPAVNKALANATKGMRLLVIVHAIKEGYKPGSRSYKHNNPGNVGNTDSGNNKGFPTLEAGILHLRDYIQDVADGKRSSYPLGRQRKIKPYYSKEIANNQKTYGGKSPYLPGYVFTYTGQIDQYVKIYSTGARSGNSYLSLIISYFNQNGIKLTPESKIQDIIKMN